ncbi:MAG: hypothetical protein H6539_03765 [Bacteroidales bacterium]|nr:hypothetical protein [Bacteroidales bacterium]
MSTAKTHREDLPRPAKRSEAGTGQLKQSENESGSEHSYSAFSILTLTLTLFNLKVGKLRAKRTVPMFIGMGGFFVVARYWKNAFVNFKINKECDH